MNAIKASLDNMKFCMLSAFLATLGSIFVKYSMTGSYEDIYNLALNTFLFIMGVIANSANIGFSIKSQLVLGTGKALVINFALKFILSAFSDNLLFQTKFSSIYYTGIALMILGITLIIDPDAENQKNDKFDKSLT